MTTFWDMNCDELDQLDPEILWRLMDGHVTLEEILESLRREDCTENQWPLGEM